MAGVGEGGLYHGVVLWVVSKGLVERGKGGYTFAKKLNWMWSPTSALISLGENFSVLFQPTDTGIVIAFARANEAAAARAVEKYIFVECEESDEEKIQVR